jgi:hypothetical protein
MPLIYALLTWVHAHHKSSAPRDPHHKLYSRGPNRNRFANVLFLAAVLYQIRTVAQAPPSSSFPESLLIAFRAFVTLACAGILNTGTRAFAGICCAHGSRPKEGQSRALSFILFYWANELFVIARKHLPGPR